MFSIYPSGNNYPKALEWIELRRAAWVEFENVGVFDKDIFLSPCGRYNCLGKVERG